MFDYTIGNPPYQSTTVKKNGTMHHSRVYDKFQMYASSVSGSTVMIYPPFWQNNTLIGFGKWLMDNGIAFSEDYSAKQVFPSIMSNYRVGVVSVSQYLPSVVIHNGTPFSRKHGVWLGNEISRILFEETLSLPKLNSNVGEITKLNTVEESQGVDFSSERSTENDVAVWIKKTRGFSGDSDFYYAPRSVLVPEFFSAEHVDEFSVAVPNYYFKQPRAFNVMVDDPSSGFVVKVFNSGEVFSKTYNRIAGFKTKREAENFANYLKTNIVSHLLVLCGSKKSFGCFVPDLVDYSDNNPDINWDEPLDEQISELFHIRKQNVNHCEPVQS